MPSWDHGTGQFRGRGSFIAWIAGVARNDGAVDVIRYFILHSHSGIYIDPHMECLKPPSDLLSQNETCCPAADPGRLSAAAVIAAPVRTAGYADKFQLR